MPMTPLRVSVLALALLVPVAAQAPLAVGRTTVAWTNPTSSGSPVLDAVVYYPALTSGAGVPIAAHPAGWPVVVFLHGYGLVGSDYAALAAAWADAGFVVVLSNTSQWDYFGQAADAIALHGAVGAANAQSGGLFAGALDMGRVALAGHSMGGANVANALIGNPGYRCGIAFAPVAPLGSDLSLVHVPFGIFAGLGDWVTPWDQHASLVYQGLTAHGSYKFLRVLGDDCGHMNLVGLTTDFPEYFAAAMAGSIGFLQHSMDLESRGLEVLFGPSAEQDPTLDHSLREVAIPQMWLAGDLLIGVRTRVSMAVTGGPAALLAAVSMSPAIPTPFGTLLIDPVSLAPVAVGTADTLDRVDLAIDLPANIALVGLAIAFQGVGSGASNPFVLGNATMAVVQ